MKHGTRSCYVTGCRRPECKAANAEYQRRYYHFGPQGRDEGWDRDKTREFLRQFKIEEGCLDCGYNANADALQLDHVYGQKIRNVTSISSFPALLVELAKCEVRCANCHAIKTAERRRSQEKAVDTHLPSV
jgi:hypothetical protein